jgi:glycine/D-amino acid oxidase-like deaminating enzyme
VATSRGRVDARDVLAATNAYVTELTAALQRRIVPVGSHVIATEPLDAVVAERLLPRRRMAFDSKHFLYYFRLTADRRLLFGGRAEFTTPSPNSGRRAARILQRGMVAVFPELADTRVEYAWSGIVAFTRDELPHAGCLDGVFFSGGYGGHGIAMATSMGELIGRRIAGERVYHPLLDDPFPPIPLYYGKPWFLPLAGAYYRVKDWLE